jgi:hypothetical protein
VAHRSPGRDAALHGHVRIARVHRAPRDPSVPDRARPEVITVPLT